MIEIPKINIKTKDIKKALNVKNKVDKAKKTIKVAWGAFADLVKDIDHIAIGFEKNKHIKELVFDKQGKYYSIKIKGK